MFIDDRIIFIHNPRAAGTSIRRALLKGLNPNEHIPFPGNLPSSTSHNQKHSFAWMTQMRLERNIWKDRYKFAVVRNPYDRLVSFYGLFRKAHTGAKMDQAKDEHKFHKFFAAFDSRDFNALSKQQMRKAYRGAMNLSFKDWLKFCDFHNWNNCRYLDGVRPIIRIPQVTWFDGLDRVFRFEDMKEIRAFLLEMGYHDPVPENVTQHAPWKDYYDDETRAWVADVFKEDIEKYGY